MNDISIRKQGRAGRITLTRPQALNALNYEMCQRTEAALDTWRDDPDVDVILLDAEGDRAFCAGGDISEMYKTGIAGDFDYGRQFWRDEYRMNAKLAEYPKPIVSFLHGFVMGGGVGLGGHVSHRVVGESSQISMPECAIGFVPDVGGSFRLAKAPGRLGEYLCLTTTRMNAGDALHAGFADFFIPEDAWSDLKAALCQTGDIAMLDASAHPAPESPLALAQSEIDALFSGEALPDVLNDLRASDSEIAAKSLKSMARHSPLAMAVSLEMIHRLRGPSATIRKALELEYRVAHRVMEKGDFLEGIRAQIIDKDRSPKWSHSIDKVPPVDVSRMLQPLGKLALSFKENGMKIGFIGLGNMGAPMAANLIKAGHTVVGFDVAGATTPGAVVAESAAQAATGADVVISMLPNGSILQSVANDVIPAMSPGAVLLDCSTVDVESARAVAAQAEDAGLMAMDAPVSGGIGGAASGTLTFMVGGSDAGFAKTKPLFDIMGQKAVHCGPAGNGQAAKICNNMILGVTMVATCEAFALADKLGLDRQSMFDVVSTSSGYSWTMNAYCPAPGIGPQSPADNDYQPGFASELMLKDLRLSQQAAEGADADTPMGKAAAALYEQFVEAEDGKGKDFSAMLPRFEKRGRS